MEAVFPVATSEAYTTMKRSAPTAFGTAAKLIVARAGRLYRVTFVNTTATRAIVQLHDKATAPANTDVPIWMDACPSSAAGNGALTVDFGQYGIYFANGIYVAASSTTTPLTLLAGDTMVACALYA